MKSITLIEFLNLCQNQMIGIVVSISGSGRIYEGTTSDLRNEHGFSKMLEMPVNEFFISDGAEGSELYVKIGGSK